MKLASYNVQNLFLRARALNQDDEAEGKKALELHAKLNVLLAKEKYSAADKKSILGMLDELGLLKDDSGGEYALLRQNKGRLVTRHNDGTVEVVAEGRDSWLGWLDLKVQEVNNVATRATAHVVQDVDADVLAVVEAESRPALLRFSENLVTPAGGGPYEHIMLIDGNDDRGIDVGVMTKGGYDIAWMQSHVDDHDDDGRVFSRDCPAFAITTPKGNKIVVLVNHLKSKGFGGQADSNARRLRQAKQIKKLYKELVASGQSMVAVVGDLNDTPDSDPLAPLLKETNLRDISEFAGFDDGANGERPGTFKNGTASNKIDYILLSPTLFELVQAGGINRMGVWGGKHGDLFPHFPEITKEEEAASDHAAIWAEIDV